MVWRTRCCTHFKTPLWIQVRSVSPGLPRILATVQPRDYVALQLGRYARIVPYACICVVGDFHLCRVRANKGNVDEHELTLYMVSPMLLTRTPCRRLLMNWQSKGETSGVNGFT
jgi:hypothetical protein